jgi:membrane-bound metal-dependent hydrolase YbcI (DUF457 family)
MGVISHPTYRGITHYLWLWFLLFVVPLGFWLAGTGSEVLDTAFYWLVSFGFGVFSHICLDALTVSGVPLGVGKVRVRVGGLIRTGKISEWVFLALVLLLFTPLLVFDVKIGINQWGQLYENGIIDRREYEERRFKFF